MAATHSSTVASSALAWRLGGVWPWSLWSVPLLLGAAIVALPLLAILAGLFAPAGAGWVATPAATVTAYVANSLILVGGVALVTTVVGVTTGWLVAACEFPGRRMFAWLLVLPLAFPGYVAAYGYGDLLDRLIPLVVWLRGVAGFDAARLAQDVLRYAVVIAVLASVLFPYVYLAARAAFATQSRTALEAARLLGCGPAAAFFRVSLPLARPALAAGGLLVAMEVLNDYGAVAYFGIPTLTVGIFRFWFSFGDPDSAVRIAALAMLVVGGLLALDRWLRGRRRYAEHGGGPTPLARYRLGGWARWVAVAACALPVLVGFALPVGRLLHWAWLVGRGAWEAEFLRQIGHTLLLAGGATLAVVVLSVFLGYAERLHPQRAVRWVTRFAVLGYAIPAAILALGVMRGLGGLDAGVRAVGGATSATGLLLSGSVVALVLAYVVRFLAVAFLPVQAGFKRICGDLDASARCLGAAPTRTLWRVNLPLLGPTLRGCAILVFVDVLKELPLTLLLRPFNLETLGTRAFNLADQGRLQESAPACLLIVGAGLACVFILHRLWERGES